MKKCAYFIFLLLFLMPLFNVFAESNNVGIIPANIWYSKDPFEEGDKIKIYTVVYNADARDLSGTVAFFDNTVFLGKADFNIAGKSATDVSIDWNVTVGDHTIFAKIDNAKFKNFDGTFVETYLAENKTEENKRTISKKIDVAESTNNLVNSIANSNAISSIKNTIVSNTPAIVPSVVNSTVGVLENARDLLGDFSETQKAKVSAKLDVLSGKQTIGNVSTKEKLANALSKKTSANPSVGNKIEKPFRYVELFLLSVFSFIFNNKIVFYIVFFGLVFLILRFIWRLIF